jgi:hypothetical protein
MRRHPPRHALAALSGPRFRGWPAWWRLLTGVVLLRAATVTTAPPAPRPRIPPPDPWPTLTTDPPTTSAWREDALTRCRELEGLARWVDAQTDPGAPEAASVARLMPYILEHIEQARETASRSPRSDDGTSDGKAPAVPGRLGQLKSSVTGAAVERTAGNLDAAETHLLRLAPLPFLHGAMPGLEAHVNRFLPKGDPRRAQVERIARRVEMTDLDDDDRELVVAAHHAANSQRRRDMLRVRSFRNIMWTVALCLLPLVIGVAILGYTTPTAIPLCFHPVEKHKFVCPSAETSTTGADGVPLTDAQETALDVDQYVEDTARRGDVALIEAIGLIAAAAATAVALRNVRGTSTPYSLPMALAAIKLPLGALTAVLGLVLMAGNFVPGLSALDTSTQILAWAVVFGYAQQLLTRFVDQRADALLQNVGGRGAGGERAPSA